MFPAESVGAGDGIADQEDGVEDAEGDEQLVERALHLGTPEDKNGQDVAKHAQPAQDGGDQTCHPPFPSHKDLHEREKAKK